MDSGERDQYEQADPRPAADSTRPGGVSPTTPARPTRTGGTSWSFTPGATRSTSHRRDEPAAEPGHRGTSRLSSSVEPERLPTRPARPGDEYDAYDEGDQGPAYGLVLRYTAAWYGGPILLYLAWVVVAAGDRRTDVLYRFLLSLPWLAGAALASLMVAALLRWAVIGWRALTISFAGAVIGAGVVTIAHSLAG